MIDNLQDSTIRDAHLKFIPEADHVVSTARIVLGLSYAGKGSKRIRHFQHTTGKLCHGWYVKNDVRVAKEQQVAVGVGNSDILCAGFVEVPLIFDLDCANSPRILR